MRFARRPDDDRAEHERDEPVRENEQREGALEAGHAGHRGRGLSHRLMRAILAHPDLQGLRRFIHDIAVLRQAELALGAGERWQAPSFWSGFVFHADPR